MNSNLHVSMNEHTKQRTCRLQPPPPPPRCAHHVPTRADKAVSLFLHSASHSIPHSPHPPSHRPSRLESPKLIGRAPQCKHARVASICPSTLCHPRDFAHSIHVWMHANCKRWEGRGACKYTPPNYPPFSPPPPDMGPSFLPTRTGPLPQVPVAPQTGGRRDSKNTIPPALGIPSLGGVGWGFRLHIPRHPSSLLPLILPHPRPVISRRTTTSLNTPLSA